MNIENNQFISNKALNSSSEKGEGGGLYYSCDTTTKCKVIANTNTFINNYADNAGGAIKWNPLEPSFSMNTYKNNIAYLYGNDVACFA